jgi:prepilin-type N-terminal cleavage/methylation domain-containing protein
MRTDRRPPRRQRGFTLLELMAALAVGTMMVVGLMTLVNNAIDDSKGQQAALYQSRVSQAAVKYINANYASLVAGATSTVPAKVDVAALKAAQLLPASFNAQNAYGQTPCLLVLQTTPGHLDALVLTEGGSPIAAKDAAYVASNAGDGGGYVPADTPTQAQGAFKSWQVPLGAYVSRNCSGTPAGAGSLATALFFDSPGNLSADFVYRNAVPGHPELNRMNTPLHMNAKVVENTSDALCVAADPTTQGRIAVDASGRVLSCQSGVWKLSGSTFWRDPVATFASLPAGGNNVGDVRMVTGLSRAFTWTGTGWTALAVDENGNMTLPGTLAADHLQVNHTETANTPCSPNGLIAKDASGLLLSCQLGVWSAQSSSQLAYTENGDVVILKSAFKSYPGGTVFYTGGYSYDAGDDWTYTDIVRPIVPTKDGLLIINASSTMDRELISDPTVIGQFQIMLTVVNRDTGQVIASSHAMSPIFTNDTVAISTSLSKAVPKNTSGYDAHIQTGWSIYKGSAAAAFYNRSNYKNALGQTVEQTPLETTWVLDLTY